MPMTVMNNNAAAMALGELNKNTSKLAKDLQKISSGKRINSAANGASEYSVGKKMEVMIRSLGQDIINTQTGRDLIKVAEGGIQEIVDIIRNMKEMALNSANDHNTDLDRATLQKEFNQRIHEISNIAGTTNYNGRLLLNGDYAEGSWGEKEELVKEETITEIPIPTEPKPTIPTTNPLVDEPTEAVTIINAGNYTISTDGVYMLAPNYQGTITVNAGNVELRSSPGVTNKYTYINCPNSNTNLWLNDLRIDNSLYCKSVDKSIIKFSGVGNTLNLIGSSDFVGQGKNTALVNTGQELTIYEGSTNGSIRMCRTAYIGSPTQYVDDVYDTYGAILGSDGGENTNGALIINGGRVTASGSLGADISGENYIGSYGAVVGSGANSTFGSITVNGGYLLGADGGLKGACVGTGYKGVITGDITVTGGTLHGVYGPGIKPSSYRIGYVPFSGAGVGCGCGGNIIGGINAIGGVITGRNDFCGAGIGTAGDDELTSSVGYINIDTLHFTADSWAGEAIGKGASPSDPALSSSNYSSFESFFKKGLRYSVNTLTGTVGSISIKEGAIYYDENKWLYNGEFKYHGISRYITPEDIENEKEKEKESSESYEKIVNVNYYTKKYETYQPGNPLIIHTGPKANLNLQVFINSMHPIAMGMVGISVNPRENAVKSLEKLDNALEYALKEQTKMGAYQMRLSETEETLIAEHENTISAESVLTDADMAKEMSEFTKDNVLSQAAQAMLSQEQKNAGAVLQMLE